MASTMDSIKKSLGFKTEEEKQKEAVRKYQRLLRKSMRDIDREIMTLKNEEKKLILEIKKSVRIGQMSSAKIQAKTLVQNRKNVEKFHKLKAQMNGISLQVTAVNGIGNMANVMKGVSGIMTKMNKQMNIPEMNHIMREYQKESEQLDLKEEIMGETIDDAMGMDDDEEESEDVLNQILDEIGVTLNQSLKAVPQKSLPKTNITVENTPEDDMRELEQRLKGLKE